MDWNAIKTEYVTTDTSYRRIAKKYGLLASTVSRKGKQENWFEEKQRWEKKTFKKTIDALSGKQVDRVTRLLTVTDTILGKIEKALEEMSDMEIQQYRQITAALKDIKEIQTLKTAVEDREVRIQFQAPEEMQGDMTR